MWHLEEQIDAEYDFLRFMMWVAIVAAPLCIVLGGALLFCIL